MKITRDEVLGLYKNTGTARVDADVAASFKVGDIIQARIINPTGHTRLPRYVRGKQGRIATDHGVFKFADSLAHGGGNQPQHLYSVRFDARELWGGDAKPQDCLYIDLWDDYLERAE
ncbi:MAG: SH3-like domain-containing protein [Alphaproteobacteria bacterium]